MSLPRLPIVVAPLTGETLASYLRRLTTANYLQRNWLPNSSKEPGFSRRLSALTGYTEHQLVCALPELRTTATLHTWPHLIGQTSATAPTRPACTHCVLARTGSDADVRVFASHEQLVCVRHRRWVGTGDLPCPRPHQFSIRACPEITAANRAHRELISSWGRASTHSSFQDAVTCLTAWSSWLVVLRDPSVEHRRAALGLRGSGAPLSPRDIAAWYPNAVKLTQLILQQRREVAAAGRLTAEIAQRGQDWLATDVIVGLRPSGAWDVYRRTIQTQPLDANSEVEQPVQVLQDPNRPNPCLTRKARQRPASPPADGPACSESTPHNLDLPNS